MEFELYLATHDKKITNIEIKTIKDLEKITILLNWVGWETPEIIINFEEKYIIIYNYYVV